MLRTCINQTIKPIRNREQWINTVWWYLLDSSRAPGGPWKLSKVTAIFQFSGYDYCTSSMTFGAGPHAKQLWRFVPFNSLRTMCFASSHFGFHDKSLPAILTSCGSCVYANVKEVSHHFEPPVQFQSVDIGTVR